MKWTYDWLTDYLTTTATPHEIADTLTRIGLEVEDVDIPVAPVAARIVECRAHENSDHLHVLMVDDGSGTLRQVVCGAPNARVGLVSALARPGCKIGGMEIKSGKLRGVMSDGMMCSARELGIGDDHDGIIELPDSTALGTSVVDAPVVFDAGITPNRPDYLSVAGIARDLAAAGVGTFKPMTAPHQFQVKSNRHVDIQTPNCPTYRFCEIHGIKNTHSPRVIASRLAAIGINPKNVAVDVTNYICYDMGQPMHCFDADHVSGDIVVRCATPGEEFTDLFGTTHQLTDTDMVIADADGILAVAGVIGGSRAMTRDDTVNIILESAYFDPVAVRKTAKRLGLSTDASYRYERGIDPTITGAALARAASMIMDTAGGEIVGSGFAGQMVTPNVKIEYSPALLRKKTGIDMDAQTQKRILMGLDFVVQDGGATWTVYPTAARVDIQIPENIVAELVRLYGYDQIAGATAHGATSDGATHQELNLGVKRHLAARGLSECVSFGFGNMAAEQMLSDRPSIAVANPITSDLNTARNNLLGNMLNAVADNEKRGYADLNLFELGTVFDGDAPGDQHTQLVIVRTGMTAPRHWLGRSRTVDVFDAKADILSLMRGQNVTVLTDNPPRWAHPFRWGAVMQGKKKIAEFGQLHPNVARAWKIKTPVMVAIVDDVSVLPTSRRRGDAQLSDFQPITRDFAFVTDADFPAATLVSTAASADNRIVDAVIFDAFDMGDGKKSIAFTITILPRENMSDAALQELQTAVISRVESRCPAHIRDK
ncbi:MAG: phenylalanine--tRNA ligase subunit beta [Alphaproteobacteria bacterium]|nr:phenylalanine--tRNA ligase subunit beta [Alphaproteobacteria bacterium]